MVGIHFPTAHVSQYKVVGTITAVLTAKIGVLLKINTRPQNYPPFLLFTISTKKICLACDGVYNQVRYFPCRGLLTLTEPKLNKLKIIPKTHLRSGSNKSITAPYTMLLIIIKNSQNVQLCFTLQI